MSKAELIDKPAQPVFFREEAFSAAEELVPGEREALMARAKELLASTNSVLVTHYYTAPELQQLADETGGHVSDSLDMARFGKEHPASTLVVAGVRFMGETAKILSPEKRVLMPELEANCSLDVGCPADEFAQWCDQHPDRTVVVYANTSAAVKARADWVVTSSIAVDVIRHLAARGEKILWAPDRHLGEYIQHETGADMLLWEGSCIVHEEFKSRELIEMREQHPDALVLVHPESPIEVVKQADVVGSTSRLLEAVTTMDADKFIIATDSGIFYKMQQASPNKELIAAPTAGKGATCSSCAHCPWMAMNGLRNLVHSLETGANEVFVDTATAERARVSLGRMLDFATEQKREVLGLGDA